MKKALNLISILCAVRASDVTAIGTEAVDQGPSNITMTGMAGNDTAGYEQISMWDGIDVVVVAFFVVAAVWLFLSIIYSIILLLLLKLQAQGRLDLDDENFGRLECCNGFFSLNLGCIARRYAVRMTRDDGHSPRYIITRIERRAALEILAAEMESREHSEETDLVDENEAICSICLSGYEKNDAAITTKCDHRFHRSCLLDWLERQNNSECPVCRETLVTEETIWEKVQIMRNGQRKKGIFESVARIITFIDARKSHSQLEGASSNSMTDDEELSDVEQT